jgi:hypothetical protein
MKRTVRQALGNSHHLFEKTFAARNAVQSTAGQCQMAFAAKSGQCAARQKKGSKSLPFITNKKHCP